MIVLRIVQAVHLLRRLRFAGQVECFGRGGLKLESEFVVRDARLQFRVAGTLRQMLGVQSVRGGNQIALHWRGQARGGIEIQNRLAARAEYRALMRRWHEAARPVRRAADRTAARIEHHHVAREILVHRPEPVAEPRTHRGIALDDTAAVHLQHRRAVREAVRVERLDDRKLVHLRRKMRQRVRAPLAGLTVLFEAALRAEQFPGGDIAAARFEVRGLAVTLLQLGLVVEQIHLRRPAIHEEEDAGLRALRQMRDLRSCRTNPRRRRHRLRTEEAVLIQQGRERQAGEARAHLPEEFPACASAEASVWAVEVHGLIDVHDLAQIQGKVAESWRS
jgi:hypothetical protein